MACRSWSVLRATRILSAFSTTPVTYLEMLSLEQGADVIVTDSGGVQREAYYYGIPHVVIRKRSEWHTYGVLSAPGDICEAVETALIVPRQQAVVRNNACEKIKDILM